MSTKAERRIDFPLRGKWCAALKGVHFQRAAGPVVRFSLPPAALPPITVSRQKGRPFYGQAKGELRLTWRSYAGPPQHTYSSPRSGDTATFSGQRPLSNLRTLKTFGQKARQPSAPKALSKVIPQPSGQRPVKCFHKKIPCAPWAQGIFYSHEVVKPD